MIKKKTEVETVKDLAETTDSPPVKSEKEKLLDLYQILKDLNVRSISDLENLIAKTE